MSEDGEYERGYRDCNKNLQPEIDRLRQDNDALIELIKANKRVDKTSTYSS